MATCRASEISLSRLRLLKSAGESRKLSATASITITVVVGAEFGALILSSALAANSGLA